jgi:hypothetical protein
VKCCGQHAAQECLQEAHPQATLLAGSRIHTIDQDAGAALAPPVVPGRCQLAVGAQQAVGLIKGSGGVHQVQPVQAGDLDGVRGPRGRVVEEVCKAERDERIDECAGEQAALAEQHEWLPALTRSAVQSCSRLFSTLAVTSSMWAPWACRRKGMQAHGTPSSHQQAVVLSC